MDRIGQQAETHPLLLVPARRRRRADHPPARPGAPAAAARTPRSSARTRRSSRTTGTTGRLLDLYNEKAGILDGDADAEVDLASYAYQIWKNAIDADPTLEKTIADLPDVVYSTRAHAPTAAQPQGVLVYMRTADGNDALAWVDEHGQQRHRSRSSRSCAAAECPPDTPALARHARAPRAGAARAWRIMVAEEQAVGGQLGRPSGARFRTYERLKQLRRSRAGHALRHRASCAARSTTSTASRCCQSATDTLNRQLQAPASPMKTWPTASSPARRRPALHRPGRREQRTSRRSSARSACFRGEGNNFMFDEERVRSYIKGFAFGPLFSELGWDNFGFQLELPLGISNARQYDIDGAIYDLHPVAHKRGFQVFTCSPSVGSTIPPYATRMKIDRALTKTAREHLIIYLDRQVDDIPTTQTWQWVIREHNKPITARDEHSNEINLPRYFWTSRAFEFPLSILRSISRSRMYLNVIDKSSCGSRHESLL